MQTQIVHSFAIYCIFHPIPKPYIVSLSFNRCRRQNIELLTVSSIAGKEWKLTLPTNREIVNYDPPFPKRTFVKLDSLQRTHISNLSNVSMARGGKTLDAAELSEIISAIIRK